MVMFTRKIQRILGGNFTFLVLTDREDLDQLVKQAAAQGYGFRDLVHQVTQSTPFLSK